MLPFKQISEVLKTCFKTLYGVTNETKVVAVVTESI